MMKILLCCMLCGFLCSACTKQRFESCRMYGTCEDNAVTACELYGNCGGGGGASDFKACEMYGTCED